MAFDWDKVFKGAWQTLKTVVASQAAGIPGVQKEVEVQKLKAGKDVLWSAFPVILVGALAFFVIRKF